MKPCSGGAVAVRVRAVVRQRAPVAGDRLVHGPVEREHAVPEEHRAVAQPLDRGGVVRDEEDRPAALLEGRDDTESTVIVRRFIAGLRRSCLGGDSSLVAYAGTRPLRNWLADQLNESLRQRQRAAFVLDAGDSCCGVPLRFCPSADTA